MTTQMTITAIKGIQGVWSYHRPGQALPEGTGVYRYTYYWECERHGRWMPWLPKRGLPCECIQAALALREEAKL